VLLFKQHKDVVEGLELLDEVDQRAEVRVIVSEQPEVHSVQISTFDQLPQFPFECRLTDAEGKGLEQ